MTNDLIVKYHSTGQTQFGFNFTITDTNQLVVWLDDDLQSGGSYSVNYDSVAGGGSITFPKAIGSVEIPVLVTIEKQTPIGRVTNFFDITSVKAFNLNYEFNNVIEIFNSLALRVDSAVLKSNLSNDSTIIIMPKNTEGKGLYWGENGKLLNTDLNLNDFLNELAVNNPNLAATQIPADKITVDTGPTYIKSSVVQTFLEAVDKDLYTLQTSNTNLSKQVGDNTTAISGLTTKISTNTTAISTLTTQQATVSGEVNDLEGRVGKLESTQGEGGQPLFNVIMDFPKDSSNNPIYIQNVEGAVTLSNITPQTPLVLNFAYQNKVINYVCSDVSQLSDTVFPIMPKAGRYYLALEIIEGNILLARTTSSSPFYGMVKPTDEILTACGCDINSDYFILPEMTMYYGMGFEKDTPAKRIYLGYVDVNDRGLVANDSDIYLYSLGTYFETYLDVASNTEYTIVNPFACTLVEVKIDFFANIDGNIFSIPAVYQGKFNNSNANVLEMGMSVMLNTQCIKINTAQLGVAGFYKGASAMGFASGKIKVAVRRLF